MINYTMEFHCFHGTTQNNSQSIISIKKFEYDKRDDHWLGNGIYFFINDASKGWWWAKNAVKKAAKKGKKELPSLVYLPIHVNKNELLDLNTEDGQKKLKNFYEFLVQNKIKITDKGSTGDKEKDKRVVLCKVLDLIAKMKGYKAACYLFPNDSKPYLFMEMKIYGIVNNSGNQLCVYDEDLIDYSKIEIIS